MSPTQGTLIVFRIAVLVGLAAIISFSFAGSRYLLWASVVALLLGIFAVQSSGQVTVRHDNNTTPDALSRAMNGPHGLRIRIGLVFLLLLLILLGVGLLEPSTIGEAIQRFRNAA